jgi:hypothetical protein
LVSAGADLGQELGLNLLGLRHGGPAAAEDLAADVALAAGERVAAGVDLDLEAVAVLALSDHPGCPFGAFPGRMNDQGMTRRNDGARQG